MNGAEMDPRARTVPVVVIENEAVTIGPDDVLAVGFPTGGLDDELLAHIKRTIDDVGLTGRVLVFEGVNLAAVRRDDVPEVPKPKEWEDVELPFDEEATR